MEAGQRQALARTVDRTLPARDLLILCGATLCVLLPFAGKAFNIDESLFLWLGRHLQASPGDFYGFPVNWNGFAQPMHSVTKNPPLTGYFIAWAASLVGWSEWALHGAFLLPALATVLGAYALARRFCEHPLEAALLGSLTPVFLVSSTTVMCDVSMLALFTWGLWTWIEGLERNCARLLVLSGVLAAACAMTKYFGMCLIPLCIAWALLTRRKPGVWCLALLIPVAALGVYQWATWKMYGRGLLFDAAGFAVQGGGVEKPPWTRSALVGLLFAGGCCIPALFYAPFLWSRRYLLSSAVAFAALAFLLGRERSTVGPIDMSYLPLPVHWATKVQMLLAGISGASLLGASAADIARRRDRDSALLFLWLAGTFVFASFLNWTNNGRSVLPITPVAGILLVRQLEARFARPGSLPKVALRLAFLPGLAVALAVTWGDFRWANSIRDAARDLVLKHGSPSSKPLWFEGHWGFQYYMQLGGAFPLDLGFGAVQKGERIVVPVNNVDLRLLQESEAAIIDKLYYPEPAWVRTISWPLGAGFYSSIFGPLPYAFGPAQADEYVVYQAHRPFEFNGQVLGEVKKDTDR